MRKQIQNKRRKKENIEFSSAQKAAAEQLRMDVLHGIVPKKTIEKKKQVDEVLEPFAVTIPDPIPDPPVYILIRTHNRPKYFETCMESIKGQTYKNIVTIIHSDDPRDDYAVGDIVIQGHCLDPRTGSGPYNWYNNRLLEAIPDGYGWYHWIDDDDYYAEPDVIEKMVALSLPDHVNVCHVERNRGVIWPRTWLKQKSYQTECFFLHTAYKDCGRWGTNTGGDHYYSGQMTKRMPINWIDEVLICRAQDGKNRGRAVDKGRVKNDYTGYYDKTKIVTVMLTDKRAANCGEILQMEYIKANQLERLGKARVTFNGVTVIDNRIKDKNAEYWESVD